MSLKVKLIVPVVLAALLGAMAIVGIFSSRARVQSVSQQGRQVQDFVNEVLSLNVQRSNYLQNRHEDEKEQFLMQLTRITQMLQHLDVSGRQANTILARMRTTNNERVATAQEFIANYEAMTAGQVPADVGAANDKRLNEKLFMLSQGVVNDASQLFDDSAARLRGAENFAAWLTASAIALIVLMIAAIAWIAGREVLSSISALKRGTEAVSGGDLDYRIDLGRKDEFGELAVDFNEMTSQLALTNRELSRHQESLEELVRERTQKLSEANEELDAYDRAVSHDLRAPLAAAIMANDLLLNSAEQDDVEQMHIDIKQWGGAIDRSLSKANELISGLLSLAQAGQRPSRVTWVSVSDVLSEILDERAAEIAESRVEFVVDDDLGRVLADRLQLYQLFSNLISNSIRHNDNERPVTEVRYRGEVEGVHSFLVKDNGSGFAHGTEKNLFKPFFKAGKRSGTGIGLSIVKRIVEAYDGRIKAYNDQGACFTFTLRDQDGRAAAH